MDASPIVARFSIAPVKGLGLLHPDEIELTEHGVVEDRRFFLLGPDGRHIDGLIAGRLVRVGAWTDPDATRLRLTLPDGEVVEDEVTLGEPVIVGMYGRTAVGHVVQGPWAAALEPLAGRPVQVVRTDRAGGTRKQHYSTIVTDGSLRAVERELRLVEPIDARRFRMTIELAGGDEHEEDTWIGSRIGLGAAVLRISEPVPRCAITTQDPETGVRDFDTLHALRAYRGLRDGEHLDFGVYGEVEVGGTIRLGDPVRRLGTIAAAS